jgi:hypothetical protein
VDDAALVVAGAGSRDCGSGIMMIAQVLWQSPTLLPAAIATLGVMLAALLWLYPPQVRGLPRPWRWFPTALRAMTITALVVSLLQPAVLRPRTTLQQGTIAVLIDRSRSMSAVDVNRTPSELVSLAAGLGALPRNRRIDASPGLRAELARASALLDDLERARNETEYARLSGRGAAAAQSRMRDISEALLSGLHSLPAPTELAAAVAELKQTPAALDPVTTNALRGRLNAATAALAAFQAQVDQKLYESDAQVRDACSSIGQSTRMALAERALLDQPIGVLAKLRAAAPLAGFAFDADAEPAPSMLTATVPMELNVSPDGVGSDIPAAIASALRRLRGRSIQAVAVFSDGRQVARGGNTSSDLSSLGLPVYTVYTGAPLRRDVSIVTVDLPDSAHISETVAVRVDVQGIGVRGATADVRLDIGEVRQIQRITLGEDLIASTEFQVTPSRGGAVDVVVSVQPLGGEASDDNNLVRRVLKVAGEPLRVTLISGADAGKQQASVHEALSRAAWVRLREVEEYEIDRLPPAAILSQDVVVLCDVPSAVLSSRQWDALDRLVRQRGGSVVLMAGAHLPIAYAQDSVAADWLPQDPQAPMVWRIWPGGEPHFRLLPVRSAETAELVRAWENLAVVSRIAPLTKPRPGVKTLLADRETQAAVVTESTRGTGHVLYIGTEESWRWRPSADVTTSQQFWPALLHRAAPDPYAAVEGNLALDVDHLDPEPGESVAIRARVLGLDGLPVDSSTQSVEIWRDGQRVSSVALSAQSEGRYRGSLELPAGDYVLRLEPPTDASVEIPADPVVLSLRVAERVEAEMSDLSGDPETLRRMAESSGGKALTLDEVGMLPQLLADNRAKQSRLVEYPLWDSPYLFMFVLACLSAEWSLRKKFGLA